MINKFEKFGADKLNLTLSELNGLLILTFCFLSSLIYSEFEHNKLSFENKKVLIAYLDNLSLENEDNLVIDNLNKAKLQIAKEKRELKKLNLKVDILTASKLELTKLPGIGPKTAEEIIEYRVRYGFDNNEDIVKVKGVGEKTYEKIKNNLSENNFRGQKDRVISKKIDLLDTQNNVAQISGIYEGSKIDINTASSNELIKLDGIGTALAKRIIEFRSETKFEKIEDLMKVSGISKKKFEKVRNFIEIR